MSGDLYKVLMTRHILPHFYFFTLFINSRGFFTPEVRNAGRAVLNHF